MSETNDSLRSCPPCRTPARCLGLAGECGMVRDKLEDLNDTRRSDFERQVYERIDSEDAQELNEIGGAPLRGDERK